MNEGHRVTPILLWGMMGAGKSALARYLSERCGVTSVDLDAEIVALHGATIATLIETRGLVWFRQCEQEMLVRLMDTQDTPVIALGGGTLLDVEFRALVRSRAYVCTLTAQPETLLSRVSKATGERPLLDSTSEDSLSVLEQLLSERQNAYLDSDCVVDTTHLSVAQSAQLLMPLFFRSEAA
jgi:shikimate kinase